MLGISAVTVSFTFDVSVITKDTEIVAFETLYRDETEIAVHADIDEKDQTVTIHPQPEPEKPQTGDNSNIGFWIGLGARTKPSTSLIKLHFVSFKNTIN